MELILPQCNGNKLDLLSLLNTEEYKNKLKSFFVDGHTWSTAVLQQFQTTDYYKDFVTSNMDVVFDIGAHIGLFSLYIQPYARKIYSFEPSPRHFDFLNELSKPFSNINLYNVAISNKTGQEQFFEDLINNTQNSLAPNGHSVRSLGNISCYNLFDFCNENKIEVIDFIKMDIEGGELNVIMDDSFSRMNGKIKCMHIEVHNTLPEPFHNAKLNFNILFNRLKEIGYSVDIFMGGIIIARWD
jgi:FkbM family methyltransferase